MPVRPAIFGILFVGTLIAAGCTSEPARLVTVSGRVTYAGAPMTRGVIVFTPDADNGCYGPSASAELGADGTYVLTTDGAAGATPGWHRVTVAALDATYGPKLPARFCDPGLSKLRAEVRAAQDNVIDFKLEGP